MKYQVDIVFPFTIGSKGVTQELGDDFFMLCERYGGVFDPQFESKNCEGSYARRIVIENRLADKMAIETDIENFRRKYKKLGINVVMTTILD